MTALATIASGADLAAAADALDLVPDEMQEACGRAARNPSRRSCVVDRSRRRFLVVVHHGAAGAVEGDGEAAP